MRDLTQNQFVEALKRHGIGPCQPPFGYHFVTPNTMVCAANAGSRRRDQLAYLLREQERSLSREEKETR